MDIWGQIYRDHWESRASPHAIERDDGVVLTVDSAAGYFDAPRSKDERELLDQLEGPVLELGCGPGSHALYLQNRGLAVTATDDSPGAIAVCRARGCTDARLMDMRALELPDDAYRAILVMGNTLGVHQRPETLPALLSTLRRAMQPGGQFLCSTIDPLVTDDPVHLEYHRRNRERGLPPGLVTVRMRYGDLVDEWIPLWLATTEELDAAFAEAAWGLVERRVSGPLRTDCYVAR